MLDAHKRLNVQRRPVSNRIVYSALLMAALISGVATPSGAEDLADASVLNCEQPREIPEERQCRSEHALASLTSLNQYLDQVSAKWPARHQKALKAAMKETQRYTAALSESQIDWRGSGSRDDYPRLLEHMSSEVFAVVQEMEPNHGSDISGTLIKHLPSIDRQAWSTAMRRHDLRRAQQQTYERVRSDPEVHLPVAAHKRAEAQWRTYALAWDRLAALRWPARRSDLQNFLRARRFEALSGPFIG